MATIISKLQKTEGFPGNKEFIFKSYSINLLDSSQMFTKRTFDLFSSILFLVLVASWLFPIIALCISLESKGPVFYKQLRHGQNNIPFYCLKFRTMKYNPKGYFKQATKNDPRVTKVGHILRITSLDELPQFINVFLGQMSVVGPRPHAVAMNREFSEKMQNFMYRHMVKPGITGLAQARGFRGEIIDHFDINSRLRYDLFYIKNWNLLLDFKIIYLTVICILFNNGKAY